MVTVSSFLVLCVVYGLRAEVDVDQLEQDVTALKTQLAQMQTTIVSLQKQISKYCGVIIFRDDLIFAHFALGKVREIKSPRNKTI
jgi:hypothetical protein